jgi:hypothetical protein
MFMAEANQVMITSRQRTEGVTDRFWQALRTPAG